MSATHPTAGSQATPRGAGLVRTASRKVASPILRLEDAGTGAFGPLSRRTARRQLPYAEKRHENNASYTSSGLAGDCVNRFVR
jgi:hypothetical protein